MMAEAKELKKPQVPEAGATLGASKVRDFVGDIKTELQKITWTSKEELLTYTKIVVGATFVLGMAIYFIDVLIQLFLSGLDAFVRLFVG